MKITDEMLYRHAAEARDIWLDTLPDDNEIPEHQFSDEFNKEMDRLITLSHKRKQPSRRLQRIAAMFAVIIIGASSFIGVNAEARAAFVGWIKEVADTYFVYRYEGESDVSAAPTDYRPTWLPDGYTEFYLDDSEDTVFVVYSNEAGEMLKLSYAPNPDQTSWFVNTSNTVRNDAKVNGVQADLFIATDPATSSALMWVDKHNTAFLLDGFLDEETLIYVAEHIEPVDLTDANVSEPTVSTSLKYELAQIPNGYTELFSDHADEGGSALYENEIGQYLQFMYTSNSGDSNLFIETTSSTIYQTDFNGYTATVMVTDDPEISNSISWVGENDTVFYVSGFFDVDSLFDIAGSIKSSTLEEVEADNSTRYYELTLIPDGYSLVNEIERENKRSLLYEDESGQMIKYHCLAPHSLTEGFIDIENTTQKSTAVNGHHADLLLSNDTASSSCIVWTDEHNYTHVLHAFLDEETLIELAESVKIED